MLSRKKELCFLLIIVAITIGFHLYDFGLPPLWPDELSYFLMNQSLTNPPGSDLYNYALGWGLHLGRFPFMATPYVGSIGSYLSAPFTDILGPNVSAIRSYEAFTTILIVISMYYAGKELFSQRVGIISSSLLATFPFFIFYSRQSITYDWILLTMALLIVIFGLRYMKTLKSRYLFGSLFLIGLGVWDYLWFTWFVIGLMITTPFWIKNLNSKLNIQMGDLDSSNTNLVSFKRKKKEFLIIFPISLIIGFIPIIYSAFSPDSEIKFILGTLGIGKDTGYLRVSNADILNHLILRGHHLFEILGKPLMGLNLSNINIEHLTDTSYIFPLLFVMALTVSIIHMIYKRSQYKRIICLLLIIFAIYLTSIFTVTVLYVLQYGIILPFVFLLIGKGIDNVATNRLISSLSSKFRQISTNHIVLIIIISIVILQVPIISKGYYLMGSSPVAHTNVPYEQVHSYMKENNLKFVSFDFFTEKTTPFYTNGVVPYVLPYGTIPYFDFDENVKKSIPKLESMGLLKKEYLFVVYVYPKILPCDSNFHADAVTSNYCGQFYFVESAAERNNKHLEVKDFPLPDGTPYFRTFRFID